MIRVFLADDHAVVRLGLRKLLDDTPDLRVIGECDDGLRVPDAVAQARPDVLLLDLSLPRLGGMEVLRRVRAQQPSLRVVVLSLYPEEQYAARVLHEGAVAYLSKSRGPEELLDALRRAARGGAPEPSASPRAERLPHDQLSAREHQIFSLLLEGRSVSDIAAELNIGLSTASTHLGRIRDKLGARSNLEIVSYAHRVGLVD